MVKDATQRIIVKAIILIAVCMLAWPAVAHISSAIIAVQIKNDYAQGVGSLNETDYSKLIESAQKYNDSLADTVFHTPNDAEYERYMSLLNVAGTGVMGRISIPKINVELPVYHDVTEDVLQIGVGHVPGTSLPVASKSSHVVISGHTGLALSAIFTELTELEIGDTFQISVLNNTLLYEVDEIVTMLPDDMGDFNIEPNREYCTLITCTPLGINDHRLLVRGHRVETQETAEKAPESPQTFGDLILSLFQGKLLATYEAVMLAIAFILITAEFVVPLIMKMGKTPYKL